MELEFSILFLGTSNSLAAVKGEWHASCLCWGANETTHVKGYLKCLNAAPVQSIVLTVNINEYSEWRQTRRFCRKG